MAVLLRVTLSRRLPALSPRLFSSNAPSESDAPGVISVRFVDRDGRVLPARGREGDSLLEVVTQNQIHVDGYGACEGTLACSTCHVLLPRDTFHKMEPPGDDELDLLDLATGVQSTSRLGCQVTLTRDLQDATFTIANGSVDTRNQGLKQD
ncbi:adrenodoxin, mitochondrial isoform X1 [Lethenteron reissneri]|uniref:adrenodoxin, mitochondrial isoform X1 n=1 Tax=Lethenteron reissneri TaxID=7753 RepID=UPI002AB5FE21|nr:adrenodoxin, mitochondrial isoform X1 [Lethenteron reissneri]